MAPISIPTTAALSSAQLIPASHPAVTKLLNRLSRSALLTLALDWLSDAVHDNIHTHIRSNDDDDDDDSNAGARLVVDPYDLYPPARSRKELRGIYRALQTARGSRRDVVDRIIEGDWRNGLTLEQLAMADMRYLREHPQSQRWTAWQVVQRRAEDGEEPEEDGAGEDESSQGRRGTSARSRTGEKETCLPRFHPSTFLRNLQQETFPDIKAHYSLDRHERLPLLILRIFIVESPYNTNHAMRDMMHFDASKTFYVAFPDNSPYVFVSLTTTLGPVTTSVETRNLRRLTLEGIPKAFSRPRQRYGLRSTQLSTRNLEALVGMRGGGRTNQAGGGWAIYAEKNARDTPLHSIKAAWEQQMDLDEEGEMEADPPKEQSRKRRRETTDVQTIKRRKAIAKGRFGTTGSLKDGKGLERFDVMLSDSYRPGAIDRPAGSGADADVDNVQWRPRIQIAFHGTHVFAGLRGLVEQGVVDGERLPAWMTGEDHMSHGVVKEGRLVPWPRRGVL